eukprot:1160303-Pelagomonas_calceolata.AAC.5
MAKCDQQCSMRGASRAVLYMSRQAGSTSGCTTGRWCAALTSALVSKLIWMPAARCEVSTPVQRKQLGMDASSKVHRQQGVKPSARYTVRHLGPFPCPGQSVLPQHPFLSNAAKAPSAQKSILSTAWTVPTAYSPESSSEVPPTPVLNQCISHSLSQTSALIPHQRSKRPTLTPSDFPLHPHLVQPSLSSACCPAAKV